MLFLINTAGAILGGNKKYYVYVPSRMFCFFFGNVQQAALGH